MHPIEHVMRFAPTLLFLLIPSHPLHMINLMSRLGLAPSQGDTGFNRIKVGENANVGTCRYSLTTPVQAPSLSTPYRASVSASVRRW